MKTILKAVAVAVSLALITAAAPTKSYAGDDEWATVGKVLTGVAAVGLIAILASQADGHTSVHASYGAPPPPPPRCEPPRQWMPGHYECRREPVCQPAHWDTVVDPVQYSWVRHGWRREYVMIKPECERRIWVPERTEWQETKIWVPGHFEAGTYAYNR